MRTKTIYSQQFFFQGDQNKPHKVEYSK